MVQKHAAGSTSDKHSSHTVKLDERCIYVHMKLDRSAVFLAGAAGSRMPVSATYLHKGIDYNGETY